ncbi:MAG: hypothetical protein ACKV2T_41000 [Kofleriaceae bacterium]
MTSLAELRSIEEQRMASERAARIAEDEAHVRAKAAAEQAVRDAEEKRIADERAAALAIEQARVAAEREARMKVEAAEAVERARHQAALDEARLAQEMEIAHELARRTKPKWMLVVTVGAVLAASGLTWFAIDQMRVADEADRKAETARIAAEQNKADIQALDTQLVALNEQQAENSARLTKAINDVLIAEGTAAIAESKRKLKEIEDRQRELNRQRAAIAAEKAAKDRVAPITIKKECLDGVIGKKGC